MPMTTDRVPHLREPNVAEASKKTEQRPESRTEAKPALASAAESGDPAVQRLLALVEIHESNGDGDKAKETRRELADLGFK